MHVYQLDKSPRAGWLGQSINMFIIWRINSQIQYLEGVLKSCYSFQFKKEMVCEIFAADWFWLAWFVTVFILKSLKEKHFRAQLEKYLECYGWLFKYFFLVFLSATSSLHACLLKVSLIRWLWTSTASNPGCESELHASVSLGNRLKLSVTWILCGRLWIITILSHCILMRLSNLK